MRGVSISFVSFCGEEIILESAALVTESSDGSLFLIICSIGGPTSLPSTTDAARAVISADGKNERSPNASSRFGG
jgi:hypothetical protein